MPENTGVIPVLSRQVLSMDRGLEYVFAAACRVSRKDGLVMGFLWALLKKLAFGKAEGYPAQEPSQELN